MKMVLTGVIRNLSVKPFFIWNTLGDRSLCERLRLLKRLIQKSFLSAANFHIFKQRTKNSVCIDRQLKSSCRCYHARHSNKTLAVEEEFFQNICSVHFWRPIQAISVEESNGTTRLNRFRAKFVMYVLPRTVRRDVNFRFPPYADRCACMC